MATEILTENSYETNQNLIPLEIDSIVIQDGWRKHPLNFFLQKIGFLKARCRLLFNVQNKNDFPNRTKFYWKTLNCGKEAYKRNKIRGSIMNSTYSHEEPTSFRGNHYVEYYAVFEREIIGRKRIYVPIGENEEEI